MTWSVETLMKGYASYPKRYRYEKLRSHDRFCLDSKRILLTCCIAADEAVQISFGCEGLGRHERRHAVAVAVATMVRSPIDILDLIPKRAFMPLTWIR